MTDEGWREGVLSRLAKLEVGQAAQGERLGAIELNNAVAEAHHKNVERRLTGIEDTLKWLVRLVFGAIIAAAVAFALKGGFVI